MQVPDILALLFRKLLPYLEGAISPSPQGQAAVFAIHNRVNFEVALPLWLLGSRKTSDPSARMVILPSVGNKERATPLSEVRREGKSCRRNQHPHRKKS